MVSEKSLLPHRVMNIDTPTAKSPATGPVLRARQLRALIEAEASAVERACALTPKLLTALHDARLFKMLLPRSIGGDEIDPLTFITAIEEIAIADGSTAWCIAQASGCSMAAAYVEPAVAQEIFGDKDAVLAWGPVVPAFAAWPAALRRPAPPATLAQRPTLN